MNHWNFSVSSLGILAEVWLVSTGAALSSSARCSISGGGLPSDSSWSWKASSNSWTSITDSTADSTSTTAYWSVAWQVSSSVSCNWSGSQMGWGRWRAVSDGSWSAVLGWLVSTAASAVFDSWLTVRSVLRAAQSSARQTAWAWGHWWAHSVNVWWRWCSVWSASYSWVFWLQVWSWTWNQNWSCSSEWGNLFLQFSDGGVLVSQLSLVINLLSSELWFKFLNLRVQSSDLNFILLSVSLDVDTDLRFCLQATDFIGEAGNLTSQWGDDSFLIFGNGHAWLSSLPFDVSFSEDLVFSFKFSESTLESQEVSIRTVNFT